LGAADALPERVEPESLQAIKFPPVGGDDGVGIGEVAAAGSMAAHSLTAVDAAARAAALADAGAAAAGAPPRAGQSAVRQALANAQGLVKWQQTQAEQTLAPATLSGASARDVFTDQALQPSARAADSAALPGVLTAVGGSDAQVLRQRERSSAGPGASRFEPMNFSGTVVPAFDVSPAAAPAPAAAPLAASLAEQVKYWMTNDIRNAELKLDGLGTEPVQVSITMSGNEAQVVFRSDQAQTRELLGNAMGQLEQLLRGEGLALAGAWVGASGQQAGSGGGTQQGQAGSASPQQALARDGVSSASAAPTGRRVVPTERVLDLFA
jgi:flagellar hook-length control protein FliK